jgi:hypothetical protein
MTTFTWNPSERLSKSVPDDVSGVYRIRNLATGQLYVGSTNNLRRRWLEHARGLNQGNHPCQPLARDWRAQGKATFRFELVARCGGSELPVVEQLAITKYGDRLYNKQRNVARPGTAAAKQRALLNLESHLKRTLPVRTPSPREQAEWESTLTFNAGLGLLSLTALVGVLIVAAPDWLGFVLVGLCWLSSAAIVWTLVDSPHRRLYRAREKKIQERLHSLRLALYAAT